MFTTDPRRNGINAPRDATIEVTFTEAVDVDPALVQRDAARAAARTTARRCRLRRPDHYITPNDNFTPGEQCTVTILKDQRHDRTRTTAVANTDTLPADYAWSFTVATGTAPPYPPDVHLTMGNPSGATADVNPPNNYLMEKPEFALSYNRDLGRPNWVSWHLSNEWIGTLDARRHVPSRSRGSAGLVSRRVVRLLGQRLRSRPHDAERRPRQGNLDADQPGDVPDVEHGRAGAGQQPGSVGGVRRLPAHADRSGASTRSTSSPGPSGVGGTGSNGGTTTTRRRRPRDRSGLHLEGRAGAAQGRGDDLSRVNCSTRTIAVIMPNIAGHRTRSVGDYLTTVDAVEALTGYDFFSNLPKPYSALHRSRHQRRQSAARQRRSDEFRRCPHGCGRSRGPGTGPILPA